MIDLSGEIRKFPPSDSGRNPLQIGVVFPNAYKMAAASLSYQTIHLLAASIQGIVTHRIVLENSDGVEYPTRTLEEKLEIGALDAILVSCAFELDYLHLVRILRAAGIEPLRQDRDNLPLVIIGGTASTANPEPMAPFADAIGIGEAEEMLPSILAKLKEHYTQLAGSRFNDAREQLYAEWDRIEGVYVPSMWEDKSGRFDDRNGKRIKQATVPDMNEYPSYTPVITPDGVYGAKNLVEISRGCTTRCRFCLISYISPAGRERTFDNVLENARRFSPKEASIGLVSSSVGDHPDIIPIIDTLHNDGYGVSVSSLKVSSTSMELIEALSRAGAKSVTFAPEHGSDKIRKVICKEYTYENVKTRLEWAFEAGMKRAKLYFLTGFEEETEADLKATTEFILSLADDLGLASSKKGLRFTVGLAPLVPKAATPFQRRAMQDESMLKRKMRQILEPVRRHPRIDVETESVKASIVQAMLSQGDRGLAEYLAEVSNSRGPILKSWDEAMLRLGNAPLDSVLKPRPSGGNLPWSFIKRPDLGGKSE